MMLRWIMRSAVLACALGLLVTGMSGAYAAESRGGNTKVTGDLAKIVQDQNYQKAVFDAAQKSSVWVKNPCGDAKFSISTATIYQPLTLDKRARPASGAWKESVAANGCDSTRQLNVLTIVRPSGKLVSDALLPGTTHAGPKLQKDAAKYAISTAGGSCGEGYVVDTAYLKTIGEVDKNLPADNRVAPWKEEWIVVACDSYSLITMEFVPDQEGTTIRLSKQKSQLGFLDIHQLGWAAKMAG